MSSFIMSIDVIIHTKGSITFMSIDLFTSIFLFCKFFLHIGQNLVAALQFKFGIILKECFLHNFAVTYLRALLYAT